MYIIKDWAGNIMFNGKKFESFEDGENFLSNFLDEDYEEHRGEIFICEAEGHLANYLDAISND